MRDWVAGAVRDASTELAYCVFDNRLVNATIGSSGLSQVLLTLVSVTAIIAGSFASIRKPANALEPSKGHPLYDVSDGPCKREKDILDDEDDNREAVDEDNYDQQLSLQMTLMLPVLASMALVGMHYATKRGFMEVLLGYFHYYTFFLAIMSVSTTVKYFYEAISRNLRYKFGISLNGRYGLTLWRDVDVPHKEGMECIELPESTERERIIKEETVNAARVTITPVMQEWNIYFSTATCISVLAGVGFAALFACAEGSNDWILTCTLGTCIVVMGISNGSVPSFKIGTLLLSLFFFYDIYFVFGTEIMQTVATKVDIPAKLIMPNIVSRSGGKITHSILGLGDLALPGSFIALCLRFDLYRFHAGDSSREFHHLQNYSKPYFTAAMVAYVAALAVTFRIVHVYKRGQPALLYLCPAVLGAVYATAAWRGELQQLWAYSEEREQSTDGEDIDIESDSDSDSDTDESEVLYARFVAGEPLRDDASDSDSDAAYSDSDDE